ncbi:MAG TPA: hypothetical protein VGI78_00435 [Acetobacteraceae bacterium]|jgi:hypothetical protein
MDRLRAAKWFAAMAIVSFATIPAASAQTQTTSVGPGRIICRSATSCELGIGTPASIKFKIDASALPTADKDHLTRQCTAKSTPCIVTLTGTETATGIKAASIKFYN